MRRRADVLAQRLEKRLERDQRLLRRPPGEHQRSAGVRTLGRFGEQPCLADTGITAEQQHSLAAPSETRLHPGLGEPALELIELGDATDHGRRTEGPELGRQRDRVRHRRRGDGRCSARVQLGGPGLHRGTQERLVGGDRLR